ncbi:MAG: DUF4012 domain-containing protein [Actinomycetota bacterium]
MTTPAPPRAPDADAADGAEGPRDAPGARPSRRRAIWSVVALSVVLLGLLTIATLVTALGARSALERGTSAIQAGRRELADGRLTTAAQRFTEAEEAFQQGLDRAGGGVGGVLSHVPILGRTLIVASGVAEAGRDLSAAGAGLTDRVAAMPEGLGSLAPDAGRIPIERLSALADDVEATAAQARIALATVRATPDTLLPSVVADARFEAEEQTATLSRSLDAAAVMIRRLPEFAGADGTKRYLLIAESPAEQRGTGGIWGAYAVMTATDGRLSFAPFSQLQVFPEIPPDELPAPSSDYRENYDHYGGAGAWTDLNMTPDLPSAARALLSSYAYTTGETMDGVVVADPFAVREMLKVTGRATIPSLGVSIGPGSVVDFMTNEAYTLFPFRGRERKTVLGAVVGQAFDRFLEQPGRSTAKLKAIAKAVGEGHLRLYSTDPALQRALQLGGLDGGLHIPPGSDLLAVHVNSRSGSKVDYYATRTIRYSVRLGGDGEAFATTDITLRNDAPTSGVPGYVIQPHVPGHTTGDNVSLISASCPGPCELIQATRNERNVGLRAGEELGHAWYQDFYATHGGDTTTLSIVTRRADVWQGNSSGGTYRVVVLPQTTVQPTETTIEVVAPGGTRVTWTSEPMSIDGDRAVWAGVPEGRTVLVVRFRAPAPVRWWRNLVRALP